MNSMSLLKQACISNTASDLQSVAIVCSQPEELHQILLHLPLGLIWDPSLPPSSRWVLNTLAALL